MLARTCNHRKTNLQKTILVDAWIRWWRTKKMPRQELCSTTILLLLSTNQIWIVPDMNDALLLGSLLGESPRCQSSLGTGKEKEYPQESRKNSPYQQGGVSHSMDTVKASVSFCYGERQGMDIWVKRSRWFPSRICSPQWLMGSLRFIYSHHLGERVWERWCNLRTAESYWNGLRFYWKKR
jgi:hypothetical protein